MEGCVFDKSFWYYVNGLCTNHFQANMFKLTMMITICEFLGTKLV